MILEIQESHRKIVHSSLCHLITIFVHLSLFVRSKRFVHSKRPAKLLHSLYVLVFHAVAMIRHHRSELLPLLAALVAPTAHCVEERTTPRVASCTTVCPFPTSAVVSIPYKLI